MKRILKKILWIVLVLIGLCYNSCYADVIVSPEAYIIPIVGLGAGIIGIIIFTISVISFFVLKATIKKDISINANTEVEENKKKLNKNKNRIYVWGMVLAIAVHLLSEATYYDVGSLIFWIPIIIFIISAIIRKKSKKISNILYIISICIIVIISIGQSIDV